MRNMDYYPSHEGLQRGAFNVLQQLVRSPIAMERFRPELCRQLDYDGRKAGTSDDIKYTNVVRSRGLSVWKSELPLLEASAEVKRAPKHPANSLRSATRHLCTAPSRS